MLPWQFPEICRLVIHKIYLEKGCFQSVHLDTRCKSNVHKTFRRHQEHLLNVLCTFNLRSASRVYIGCKVLIKKCFYFTFHEVILNIWNFIEITLRHGCSPVNLLDIFRTPFSKTVSGGLLCSSFCHLLGKNTSLFLHGRSNTKKMKLQARL